MKIRAAIYSMRKNKKKSNPRPDLMIVIASQRMHALRDLSETLTETEVEFLVRCVEDHSAFDLWHRIFRCSFCNADCRNSSARLAGLFIRGHSTRRSRRYIKALRWTHLGDAM